AHFADEVLRTLISRRHTGAEVSDAELARGPVERAAPGLEGVALSAGLRQELIADLSHPVLRRLVEVHIADDAAGWRWAADHDGPEQPRLVTWPLANLHSTVRGEAADHVDPFGGDGCGDAGCE